MGQCKAASCSDLVKNGEEIGIDCGGSCPNGCPPGNPCGEAKDCASGVCKLGSCQAPSCLDGVLNGGEGGLDCGQVCPQLCGPYTQCKTNADCIGNECKPYQQFMLCLPNCFDGMLNNGESDPDCGGPCSQKCPDTWHCYANSDCQSNNCDNTGHCSP